MLSVKQMIDLATSPLAVRSIQSLAPQDQGFNLRVDVAGKMIGGLPLAGPVRRRETARGALLWQASF